MLLLLRLTVSRDERVNCLRDR